jgi:hypothetical protein
MKRAIELPCNAAREQIKKRGFWSVLPVALRAGWTTNILTSKLSPAK